MMWLGILGVVLLLAVGGAAFLMNRALRFWFPKKIYAKNRWLGILSSAWPIAVCLPFLFVGVFAFVIAFIHLFVIWALTDVIAWAIRKLAKWERTARYLCGFIALAITAVYLCYGWIMAHTVLETDYRLVTEKATGQDTFRAVALADLHAGVTLDGDAFAEQCQRINDTHPDIVLVCGDFVDDDTSREDMIKSCAALGTLKPKYGVYFVYGNHDRGYFRSKTFSPEEFYNQLVANNVKVLSDEVVAITEELFLVGREDGSVRDRKSAAELMAGIAPSKYVIVMDHQPNDYDALAESAPDLVISGHTHGGHVFPAGQIGLLMGANDALYGLEERGDTSFVVTSGISGWAIPFKTFTVSEFVVIDIAQSVVG